MKIHYFKITFLMALFLLQENLSFANDVLPPPQMSQQSKSPKKSTPIITPPVDQDKPIETQKQFPTPELVIRYKDGAKIEEYRLNGQLRYSKITPKSGPAYYLIDSDGDGIFDMRNNDLVNPPIQQWLLFTW
ncbi:MAG: DUF2782 domain-containing protein [Thiohalomonadales bacterium]